MPLKIYNQDDSRYPETLTIGMSVEINMKNNNLLIKGSKESAVIRQLQRDLRCLGYLGKGIDGQFGNGTRRAVMALQYDLLHNDGSSSLEDGKAPVSVFDYNCGRIVDVNGEVDDKTAACIADMVRDTSFPKLPSVKDPKNENKAIVTSITEMQCQEVPVPFLQAILKQESNLMHYNEPGRDDEDTFIKVGLDTNAGQKHIITSRGYGAGQYTLFHHPPTSSEIKDFMVDVSGNLKKAVSELRHKFDFFINGNSGGTRADDRIKEQGHVPLRLCRFAEDDPRFMRDCKNCLIKAGTEDIVENVTPFYAGASNTFYKTQYYQKSSYAGVPLRKNIGCDWPYAVRRYNGSGVNSYHYQVRVLLHLLHL